MEFKKDKVKQKKSKDQPTGIMNMKFMKTAEASKQERLKNDAKMLVE
jgi:U3 small nucleolar RNA-associated protein 14